jgi:protein involved in polysaccharide export with SLBB domain
VLHAGDIVTIFSQNDMAVSLDRQSKFVRLEGEFRAPGVYKVGPDDTLRSLIERAGGLTDGAYIYGTQVTRETARVEQQKSLDQMLRDMEFSVEQRSLINASHTEQQEALKVLTASQHALVEKFRNIKATGRVVLNLDTTQAGEAAFPAITLEDGDRILVPHRPSTVSVVGSVYNQNSFLYRKGMRTADYLKLAGSGTRDADMKNVFVVRADGSVLSKKTYGGMWWGGNLDTARLRPGDTVVVPAQLDKGAFMRGFRDWTQIFSQLALGAAAINVLK